MPAILIHGVPDTHRVWAGVRRHLERTDVEAWDLPGFGAPRPDGFGSTKEEYADWLIDRLEGVGEPVDLVGHDWGCILTARVASLRPDLVRTWAGGNGPISARYAWHPLARIWQDQVEGDRFMAELTPQGFAADLVAGFEVPAGLAEEMVRQVDAPMKDSIRVVKFVDCNHWPLLQRPQRVAIALEEHWQRHPSLRGGDHDRPADS
ncbi:alpha/beta fold hydrolase [Nonomuraea sp. GTA35]|uniref:alpha/beta fold hydrolase n=1 Tax=Nonomuraea sp. GTA35 TaxID=1676746 RepID=UPI0035BF2B55